MTNIHQLSLAVTIFCFVNLAYSGPCYTDTGNCNKEEQVIMVTPNKTGNGFCTESLNKKNEKESKCYDQPAPVATEKSLEKKVLFHKVIKQAPNPTPIADSDAINSTSFESTQFNDDNNYYPNGYNYSSYYDGYYNGYYNSHNHHRHRPSWSHRPHKPKPQPKPNNMIKRGNIYYVPASIKPSQNRNHYFNRNYDYHGERHNNRNGGRGHYNNRGRTAAGTITIKR